MRYSWYCHEPLNTETANELLTSYASRNIQTRKTLATDPRLWIVSALLPYSEREPVGDRGWKKNSLWNMIGDQNGTETR